MLAVSGKCGYSLGGFIFGLKGFSDAPYIWLGIIMILVGTAVWIYGDKLHGAL